MLPVNSEYDVNPYTFPVSFGIGPVKITKAEHGKPTDRGTARSRRLARQRRAQRERRKRAKLRRAFRIGYKLKPLFDLIDFVRQIREVIDQAYTPDELWYRGEFWPDLQRPIVSPIPPRQYDTLILRRDRTDEEFRQHLRTYYGAVFPTLTGGGIRIP